LPKKVLFDREGFAWITKVLCGENKNPDDVGLGFRSITRLEVAKDIIRFGAKPPSPREGRESGFIFTANGLTVKVWTTWLQKEDRPREKDSGWVLITDGEEILYSSRPFHRTKNFLLNLSQSMEHAVESS
jgi:hypothetical protein